MIGNTDVAYSLFLNKFFTINNDGNYVCKLCLREFILLHFKSIEIPLILHILTEHTLTPDQARKMVEAREKKKEGK